MLSTFLGFPKGKRVTDHCSNFAPEAEGFSNCYYHHELNASNEHMAKISFIGLCVHATERNIFTNTKFVTIYVRSTLHEKMEFLQERQI